MNDDTVIPQRIQRIGTAATTLPWWVVTKIILPTGKLVNKGKTKNQTPHFGAINLQIHD